MDKNPSSFKESKANPVDSVSWNDVIEFTNKLNGIEDGLDLYLPTEAQWEYVCRAGTISPFSFGNNITTEQVNFNGNYPYNNGKKGEYRKKTVKVKTFPPNNWGLYEMHGNVLEWCSDWYGDYPGGKVIDPEGPDSGSGRVLRGGSWISNDWNARSAYRSRNDPDHWYINYGFRLAQGQKKRKGK